MRVGYLGGSLLLVDCMDTKGCLQSTSSAHPLFFVKDSEFRPRLVVGKSQMLRKNCVTERICPFQSGCGFENS